MSDDFIADASESSGFSAGGETMAMTLWSTRTCMSMTKGR